MWVIGVIRFDEYEKLRSDSSAKVAPHVAPANYGAHILPAHILTIGPEGRIAHVGRCCNEAHHDGNPEGITKKKTNYVGNANDNAGSSHGNTSAPSGPSKPEDAISPPASYKHSCNAEIQG